MLKTSKVDVLLTDWNFYSGNRLVRICFKGVQEVARTAATSEKGLELLWKF